MPASWEPAALRVASIKERAGAGMPASWEPAALRGFVDEVVKTLRALCYKGVSVEGFGACRDHFFYASNSGVWERKQMTDAQALTLINTHVRALVEGAANAAREHFGDGPNLCVINHGSPCA